MLVTSTITSDPTVRALWARLAADKTPLAANGLWGSAAPILAALTARQLRRPLLYITAHLDQADDARDDIETLLGRSVELFPAWETLPGEGAAAGEIGSQRTRLCAVLRDQPRDPSPDELPHLIVVPIQALIQPVPSPKSLQANTLNLSVGDHRGLEAIAEFLSTRGFDRLDQVEEPGDFAIRGGIMDIFATADADPLRLEFFGDCLESIRQFEVGSQRSTRSLDTARVTLPPNAQLAGPSQTTSFLTYLPEECLVILSEPVEIAEIARTILDRLASPVGHFPIEAILRRLADFGQLHLGRFPSASVPDSHTFHLPCESIPPFEAKATDAVTQLIRMAADIEVLVCCDNRGEEERLKELVDQVRSLAPDGEPGSLQRPMLEFHLGLIHAGFHWKGAQPFILLPHHEVFRRYTQKRRLRKVSATRPIESFLDLADGDYVVHVAHGIARYAGMKAMRKGDSRKSEEFLTLQFADQATVHVPVSQIDMVQKYVGAKAARPPLSKLGGSRWQNTKTKVQEAVHELAGELLRIQAVRDSQPGVAFPLDTHWQKEFENAFLYTETPDQQSALAELKRDMCRSRPMDRLLCGDVGYGKTELAMRAAFKAIEFGKQVAVLVPTTVLAEQHLRTFAERMADYPFTVDCLNRFRTDRQQRDTIAAAKAGRIDVLIGTHRLLSADVGFADLGLVIVDEEQRFGVEHKERLKHLRTTVDVLTLTATPIPRTLHMAMVGLRDISSLATPPLDRRSIATSVCPWSDDLIRQAILRELNRDGQVYFVHNRVHSIQGVADKIRTLVPDARILIGHGQMPGDELEDVMIRFIRKDADVLVSTSIIEAGLDIPNANTILIDRADIFGLADLHQLRGRVGRYKHRAYCYLLLSPGRALTAAAAKRLKAIEQYSELGAGFRLAMRDLEIRGAGNILGPEQSGSIAAVGYELYCQLLERSVKRMKGEAHDERVAVHLELDLEAYIPKSYIASDRQRMECYRRVVACRSPQDVQQLAKDLQDAFGRCPETVDTLLTLAEVRVRAAPWNIKSIIRREPDLIVTFEGEVKRIEPLFAGATGTFRFPDPQTIHWRLPENYFHSRSLLPILVNLFRRAASAQSPGEPLSAQR